MNLVTCFRPHQRVIAKTDCQGLQKGKAYQVVEALPQPVEIIKSCHLVLVAYRLTNWPELERKEVIVKSGIMHLKGVKAF